ncbi:MAG: prepilin-type N-terminal cleavage/methylation domain-containing protein [Pirellulales bacterium]
MHALPLRGARRIGPHSGPYRGFTLIELLIAISIIGILAAAAVFAMFAAQESARETKTRSTIAKLHGLMMDRWESYRTRRLPIDLPPQPSKADEARLRGIRELLRLEMPDRWTDITDPPAVLQMVPPSLWQAYALRVQAVKNEKGAGFPTPQFQGAECLYLIVTMGPADEVGGIEQFRASEIGDTDGDGMPEFLDGWGRPISFLRWAPGFTRWPATLPPTADSVVLSDLQSGDPNKDPDPLDPRRLVRTAYALYPLVFSAGPDGRYGLWNGNRGEQQFHYAQYQNNPYYADSSNGGQQIGSPVDETTDQPGGTDYVDNLHNHLLLVQ